MSPFSPIRICAIYCTLSQLNILIKCRIYTEQAKKRWHNFITVVPLFEENYFTKKNKKTARKFPYITFGITTNNEKYDLLLYCMDYFSIKETLEDIIEDYIRLFAINMGEFCEWAKYFLERGEDK